MASSVPAVCRDGNFQTFDIAESSPTMAASYYPLMNLKLILSISSVSLAMVLCANAEATATLTDVHNCCKSCDNGIKKAVSSVPGATATTDKGTVTITA